MKIEGVMIFIIIISLILTLALYCCCISAGRAEKRERGKIKMNDSEIIKAYEEEISKPQNHYIGTVGILWNVLDLIKRQQAEIDRLNIDLKAMRGAANSWKAEVQRICKREFDNIEIDIETVKSEAVREFAEKLKEKLKTNSNYGDIYDVVAYDCIDNLVKEMGCNDG